MLTYSELFDSHYDIGDFFFLDCETSGLDPSKQHRKHYVLDFSYAVGMANPRTIYADKDTMAAALAWADEKALEVNGYPRDYSDLPEEKRWNVDRVEKALKLFLDEVKGKTFVNANPAFDQEFLRPMLQYYGLKPTWHYRLLDIQAWYAGLIKTVKPMSLSSAVEHVTALGYDITKNDHTSRNDVLAVRDIFIALNREFISV